MVLAPQRVCLKCGTIHWSTQPCAGTKAKGERFYREPVRTSAAMVVPRSVPHSSVKALEAEFERAVDEIGLLKRKLAEANAEIERLKRATVNATATDNQGAINVASKRGRPKIGKALSSTERSRKRRAQARLREDRALGVTRP